MTTLLVSGSLWKSCAAESCFSPVGYQRPHLPRISHLTCLARLGELVISRPFGRAVAEEKERIVVAFVCVINVLKKSRMPCHDESMSGEATDREQERNSLWRKAEMIRRTSRMQSFSKRSELPT